MGQQYDNYLKTISNENTKKLLETTYKTIGDYEDSAKTIDDVKRIFYATKVDTPQSARNFCAQFRSFAKSINDQHLLMLLEQIDFYEISLKVRELGVAKYFSYVQFEDTLKSINNSSILNPFYIQTLFRSIYEGIYSRDFTVLMNLRSSDIHGNIVTCRPEKGSSFDIEISDSLADSLLQLGETHSWMCRNGYREFERPISGEHDDSCFKVEKPRERKNRRSPLKTRYVNTYRKRLREIISVELGYNVFAYEIYVSGIMHRISALLHAHDISVRSAFSKNNRDPFIKKLITSELSRSNYKGSISQFKLLVEGHLELFEKVPTTSIITMVRPNQQRIIDESVEDYLSCAECAEGENANLEEISLGVIRPKRDLVSINGRHIYPRSRSVSRRALALADNRCEIDSEHPTFISKTNSLPYTEPHHLVPISYAENFDVSLDVPENIISLCSNCHNEIHYGKDIIHLLKWLYENRKQKLKLVGISITFEELAWMYGIDY